MYEPTYTITDRLLNNVVKLETNKASLDAQSLPYSVRAKMGEKSKALNLFHLAHMLGVDITLNDAEKLAEGRKLPLEDARGHILTNFRNVLEFNRSNVADSYLDLNTAILMHLNKIVLTSWRESWDVKLRFGGEPLDANLDNWVKWASTDMSPTTLQTELSELLEWFTLHTAQVNHILRLGVLIFRLIELMPFISGNKLTIIALSDFLLTRFGYTGKSFVPVTRNFDLYADEYFEAWDLAKRSGDLTLWLERFVRNLAKDIEESKTEAERVIGEEEERSSKQPFLDLNKRQLKILRYLQTIPTVKREDYCQMMDVSTMTAFRDLNELVRRKLLKIDGQGRGTKYMLASR